MAGVKSVERAIALLRAVAEGDRGLVDLAAATDLPTSTTARMLATLEDLDALTRSEDGRYQIGATVRGLAEAGAGQPTLRDLALPFMHDLALALDEAIGLSLVCGGDNLTIAQVDIPRPVQAENWEDTRWPLTDGAAGYAVVSTWTPDEIEHFIAGHPDVPDLAERIAAVPASGVWWSEGSYVEGLTSAAVSLPDAGGRAFGVLYAYGPSYRFPDEAHVRPVEEELTASANRLATAWRSRAGNAAPRKDEHR